MTTRASEEVRYCPHCGTEIAGQWVEFPPALKRKFGREGELWVPPCTPECETVNDLREWEADVSRRKAQALHEKSEMPERLARSDLDAFDSSFSPAAARGLSAVRSYLGSWEERRQTGMGLYLCGGVGTGKTHLVAGMARALIEERHVPTFFHTAPELLDRLRPSGGRDGDEWASWAMNADLLVLDDLGAEKATEWALERLFVLVNHRYRRLLPTVYTSNLGPRELSEHLGERTASRVVETSRFVLMAGPDHRVETRKKSE
jgi:DNA replication protein DnaC